MYPKQIFNPNKFVGTRIDLNRIDVNRIFNPNGSKFGLIRINFQAILNKRDWTFFSDSFGLISISSDADLGIIQKLEWVWNEFLSELSPEKLKC